MKGKCRFSVAASVLVAGLVLLAAIPAVAESVKLSVLTDMSGPYAGITAANVEAA